MSEEQFVYSVPECNRTVLIKNQISELQTWWKPSMQRIGCPVAESGRNGVVKHKEKWRMENIKKDSRSKTDVGVE